MAPRDGFVAFVVEQMSAVLPVRARAMFGGHGIFDGELMIAIVVRDTLYLKADAESRPAFEALGLQPFTYEARGERRSLGYFQAPAEVFEAKDTMRTWVRRAVDAALRAARPVKRGRKK